MPSAVGRSSEADDARPRADVLILGGSDETRLLLRGLLRLHHHRVDREVRTADGLEPRAKTTTPRVLILVLDGESDDWTRELEIARSREEGLLPLLIVPEATHDLIERAHETAVRGVLARPFAVRDLVAAVETVARGEERFPSAGDLERPRSPR